LREKTPSSDLGLGPDEVVQKGLKQLHWWRHSHKKRNPKQTILFNCRHEDLPIFRGFEQLFYLVSCIMLCNWACHCSCC